MKDFTAQRKAVSEAIRDSRRELIKAKEKGDQEWISDVNTKIDNLEGVLETLSLVEGLAKLVA